MKNNIIDKTIRHRLAQKKYSQSNKGKEYIYNWRKANYPLLRYTLFRDICPICKKRGRFRLKYIILINGNICYNSIEIQHFKYHSGKTKYDYTCYIYRPENILKFKLPSENILKNKLKDKNEE